MGKRSDFERTRVARGIKAAALVLILASAAVAADHVFLARPQVRPVTAAIASAPAPVTSAAPEGFALPEQLRHPTSGESDAPAPSF